MPYCLTIATEGILRHRQIAETVLYFDDFRRYFFIFFVAIVGGSIELGAFDNNSCVLSNSTFDSISGAERIQH